MNPIDVSSESISSFPPRPGETMAGFFVRALECAKATGEPVCVVWGERPLTITPTMTPYAVAQAWIMVRKAARAKP
jgi:hypothetical protein